MQEKNSVFISFEFTTFYFIDSPCFCYKMKRRKAPYPYSLDYHYFEDIYNFLYGLASKLGEVAQCLLLPGVENLQAVP